MDSVVLEALTQRGVVDPADLAWARAHQAELGGTLDAAVMDLDLVDESTLLTVAAECHGLPAFDATDLDHLDAGPSQQLPLSFSHSFEMCPLRLAEGRLVALVERPLPPEWVQELNDLFGLDVIATVGTAHHLTVARAAVYGEPLPASAIALEGRLRPRRRATDVATVLHHVNEASTLPAAIDIALEYARALVDFVGLLVGPEDELQVAAVRGQGCTAGTRLPLPARNCSLTAAIVHGGYFLGPPMGNASDEAFFQSLGRPVPRRAFVAPVPVAGPSHALLYADNGERAMASRWVAELSLIGVRMGQLASSGGLDDMLRALPVVAPPAAAASPPARTEGLVGTKPSNTPAPSPNSSSPSSSRRSSGAPTPTRTGRVSANERAVLERLNEAAHARGMTLDALVDSLLTPTEPTRVDPSADLVGEVKGLFERLANDIPAQLARGMESAFRDIGTRLGPSPSPHPPPSSAVAPRPSAASAAELVQVEAKPKEVASYRSKRRKAKRVKL